MELVQGRLGKKEDGMLNPLDFTQYYRKSHERSGLATAGQKQDPATPQNVSPSKLSLARYLSSPFRSISIR